MAGLSTCMMWRGRRGHAGPGPSLVLCANPLRRVLFFWWLAACGEFALRYDMWAARCPLEERVYSRRATCRSRRRARGDGVLVWSGVALPCLCGGSRRRVSSFEGERATSSFFLGCSLAPLVCKKGRVCIRLNRHGGYYYYDYYVIAPGSGRGPGGHSSPLQVVNVKAALFRRVLGIFHCPAQPSTSIAACTVVSLNRGSRAFGL